MDTKQGTPAWFSARQGKLTASRFGQALGICNFASRNQALKELTGQREWNGDMSACRWGTVHEKDALKDYQIRTGNVVQTMGFQSHPDHTWLGGSPDGLVGEHGIIEIKCPFYKMEPHTKIPEHYMCQINGLLEILDRSWCDFVSWTPTDMQVYRVYRDPALFEFLLDRYTTFYAYMKRGADRMPNMPKGEKDRILREINASDAANVNYRFHWHSHPSALAGVWEGTPLRGKYPGAPLSDESDDESYFPKRQRKDGSGERLSSTSETSSGSDTA